MISVLQTARAFCFAFVIGSSVLALPHHSANAQNSLRIAAIVNDDVISAFDLNARIWLTMATAEMKNTPETRKRLAGPILRSLIDEKLKLQEAKRLNISVTDANLDTAIARLETRNKLQPGGLEKHLEQRGIDRTSLTDQLEAQISWLKVINRVLGRRISVSDDEINERLAQMKANQGRPERNLLEIFLPVESPDREAETHQLAIRLEQSLKARHSFKDLARNFSRSSSAALGGDMGWVPVGTMPAPVESALSVMKPGQVSPVIRAQDGYYIVALVEQRSAPKIKADEGVTVDLRQIFLPLPTQADSASVTAQMSQAREIASPAKSCADIERIGAEQASSLSGSLGKVPLENLPDALRAAITDLALSTPSAPVRTRDGVVVLMVCSREQSKGGKSTRDSIADKLFNQRLMAAADEYLRDIRRRAFVDVRQ